VTQVLRHPVYMCVWVSIQSGSGPCIGDGSCIGVSKIMNDGNGAYT